MFQRNSLDLEECKRIQVKTQLSKPVHPNTENVQLRYSFEKGGGDDLFSYCQNYKLLLNEKD